MVTDSPQSPLDKEKINILKLTLIGDLLLNKSHINNDIIDTEKLIPSINMALFSDIIFSALYQSLLQQPLLIGDLPEAKTFPHQTLTLSEFPPELNLQQKLGHLYEDTLDKLLEFTPTYETVARNLQLRETNGRTLGELDFLINDHTTDQLIHLELAVKFYLAIETEDNLMLPGPDARDNYFRKLHKMRSHQLTLTQQFPHHLPELFQNKKIEVRQLVYGCLFQHINSKSELTVDFLNPYCRRGKWLHVCEIENYFSQNETFKMIPKYLWSVNPELLDHLQLESWVIDPALERCVMVHTSSDKRTPYFITPDNYPKMTY